jgi:MYXO-CTERM domain-containing protein
MSAGGNTVACTMAAATPSRSATLWFALGALFLLPVARRWNKKRR